MSYKIQLLPSGRSFMAEAGQPILAAAMAQGIGLPYSCRTGICRTCKGHVETGSVAPGEVSHEYLSDTERAEGWALLCRASALSDCTVAIREVEMSMEPKVLPARLFSLQKLSSDVAVLKLKPPMNQKLLVLPGQYIELLLKDGQRRSYSIANAPGIEGLSDVELHIRHMPGGLFTDQVFSTLKEKDMLRFEGPLGSFYIRKDSDRPIIMLASGTGFAPVKAMVESMLAAPDTAKAKRPITIYWGGRKRADLYMAGLAEQWAREHDHVRFIPVLSDATDECAWTGRTGFVHHAVMHNHPDLSAFEVYACGAPVMVESAQRDFMSLCGLPEDAWFADSFVSAADIAHAADDLPAT